jgi:hypothetical protein
VLTFHEKIRISQREADIRELVVTGLSHLVNANTEAGFKHCLPLAYEKDIRKRTIFARVFARVLRQGTKFESQETSAMTKPSLLCQVRELSLQIPLYFGLIHSYEIALVSACQKAGCTLTLMVRSIRLIDC